MTDSSKTTLSPVEEGPQFDYMYNDTRTSSNSSDVTNLHPFHIILAFICIIGLPGNGIVIYHLGFHIKRSPFLTYILNLAVADFGVLLFGGLYSILYITPRGSFLLTIFALVACISMHITSQLLLTAISIDRCVSVLFPIWHRCHRPPHLSTMVCALIWVLSCLPTGSLAILFHIGIPLFSVFPCLSIADAVLCLPLVTVSTMTLLSKVFCKAQQPRRGRLLTIVLLNLLFFLIFAFPLNIFILIRVISWKYYHLIDYGFMCAYLNSCVNPVIYYMVGRKKRGPRRQSLKVILQRAFKEEEEHGEERGIAAQTSL